MPKQAEEVEVPVPDGSSSIGDVIDAIRVNTETLADLVEAVEAMRKEYGLKKRAGVFDQNGVK